MIHQTVQAEPGIKKAIKMEKYILRSGGLVESFYITDERYTQQPDEATVFSKEEASAIVKRLYEAERVNCWGTMTLYPKLVGIVS